MFRPWLVSVFAWLFWGIAAWSAGAAEPTPPPLPEGHAGIAARYPGDAGIAGDPAVVFHDDFEEDAAPADLDKKWSAVFHRENMRIAVEAENIHRGRKAVEFTIPKQREPLSGGMNQNLNPKRDVLYLRFYSKFDEGFHPRGSCHNGGMISAGYYVDGRATPGIPADGRNKFLANYETEMGGAPPPGLLNIYCYHPEQRGRFGDHIYPTGKIVPSSETPHWFGPHFVARPDVTPVRGRWHCYEYMVQANAPGRRDGRIACWFDGKLIGDFPNFRLRDVDSLQIDCFGIGLFINPNTLRENKKWFDDVVAAVAYIGPMTEN